MGRPRKKGGAEDRILEEAAGLLGEARSESDRADSSFSWEKKIQKKIQEKDEAYLRGWLKAGGHTGIDSILKEL